MKKLMIVAAAAFGLAAFGDIESSNIVGYGTTQLAAETYCMVAAQFDDATAGTGEGIALKDLVKGEIPYETEMQIQKENGTYTIYKYQEEAYDEDVDDFVPGWADGVGNIATVKVEPGTAFWLKAPSATTVTIAGQVLSDASKTVEIKGNKYTMIGNPFPAVVNPNSLTWTGLTFEDELQVLKASGTYNIYKYQEEAYDAELDDFVPGWADGVGDIITSGVIPVGQGAWIKPAADLTVKWVSPLEK